MTRWIFGLFIIASLLTSCNKDDNQLEVDIEIIEQYIADNNLNAERLPSDVYIIKENEGVGSETPSSTSQVQIYYKGYFLDGTIFDEQWPHCR